MKRLLLVSGVIGIAALFIFFFTRGFIPYDEGWIVNLSARFFNGEVVYKNFELVYTPGVMYVTALGYFLFGQSILSERIIALLNALLSCGILLLVTKQLKLGALISVLALGTYLAWGPTHINFVWPIMFTISSTLAMVYFLNSWISKNDLKYIFFAGIAAGACCLFKQNFGVATILTFLVFVITNKEYRNYKLLLTFVSGLLLVAIGQFGYFNATSSFGSFLDDFHFIFIEKIAKEGLSVSPWPWQYPASFLYNAIKTLFYTIPLIVSLISLLVLFRKDKKLLFIPAFTFFYFVLSIRPTTDIVHLTGLIAITGIPLSLIIAKTKSYLLKLISFIFFIFLIVLGFYTAFFTNYYRWEPKIITDNYYLSNPKAKIFVDKVAYDEVNIIQKYVDSHTKKGDYVFVYLFSPAFYFTSDRLSPVHYDYASPGLYTPQIEKDTVGDLKKTNVKVVITDVPMDKDKTSVGKYITRNYGKVECINKFCIWQKK